MAVVAVRGLKSLSRSTKVIIEVELTLSLGNLFHDIMVAGKQLYLYASIHVKGTVSLKSLPLVIPQL